MRNCRTFHVPELRARGEGLRPARETGSDQSRRTSEVSSRLGKFPLEVAGRMIWRRGKNPEVKLYGRVLRSGVRQAIIESNTDRVRRVL